MITFNHALLSRCFFWFGLIVALFGVTTQISGQLLFASPYFYIQLGIFAMLAALFLRQER